jgi:hypothetical protein
MLSRGSGAAGAALYQFGTGVQRGTKSYLVLGT